MRILRYLAFAAVLAFCYAPAGFAQQDESAARQQLDAIGQEIESLGQRLTTTGQARDNAERELREVKPN